MSRVEQIGRAVTIYALMDGVDGQPRYVGKTTQRAGERHKAHIRAAKRGVNRPVSDWLRKQIRLGRPLVISHLEWLSVDANWQERERWWIAKFKQEGCNLLNMTEGGEGTHGLKFTQEHRDKIAAALRTGAHFDCLQCGTQFWRKQKDIRKGHNKFCSRLCSNSYNRGGHKHG